MQGNSTAGAGGVSLLGHRFYDASTGRFLNRDPIGYDGGVNLYGFAHNNPVMGRDSSGLQSLDDAEKDAEPREDTPEENPDWYREHYGENDNAKIEREQKIEKAEEKESGEENDGKELTVRAEKFTINFRRIVAVSLRPASKVEQLDEDKEIRNVTQYKLTKHRAPRHEVAAEAYETTVEIGPPHLPLRLSAEWDQLRKLHGFHIDADYFSVTLICWDFSLHLTGDLTSQI